MKKSLVMALGLMFLALNAQAADELFFFFFFLFEVFILFISSHL